MKIKNGELKIKDGNNIKNKRPQDNIELSIVIPVHNEQGNMEPLIKQVKENILDTNINAELIIVDDGSTDNTRKILLAKMLEFNWLIVLARDSAQGQSAAIYSGIQTARGEFIATLDGDLQNDPADLPLMLKKLKQSGADMVQGDRSKDRQDTFGRKVSSSIGRGFRRGLLGDKVRDTGCSARVVKAQIAKQFPLSFKGMHRFMPAYGTLLGAKIIEMEVHHHKRLTGKTKYGIGIFSRGVAGLFDCLAVRWMKKRYKNCEIKKLEVDTTGS